MIIHGFLYRMHNNIIEDGTLTLATIPYDDITFCILLMIMHIHKSASYAVTVRQLTYNIKLQETQGHKLKWSSVLREMCNIAWFIVKYNMICQYLAYLKKQLIQNGSILKVISNEVENNMYIRKMKTEFTAITNIIVIIAITIFSSAITGNTIIRTIGLHGIKMHHVLTTYFILNLFIFIQ